MMRRICLLLSLLALVAAGCAACSGSPGQTGPLVYPSSTEPDDGVPAPTPLVLRLHLPIDDYLLSIDEIYTVEAATDILVRGCLASRGVKWQPLDRPTFGDWRNRRRYGVIELDVAQRFGYHAVPALLGPVQVYNERVRRYRSLSHAQLVAALDPTTGCEKKGISELRKQSPPLDDSQASNLQAQSLDESQHRPAVLQALAQWSVCMAQAGYHYPDPLTASADSRWKTKSASPAEIAAAVADVQCKVRTDLVQIWYQNEVAVQAEMISRQADYFATLGKAKAQLLATASRLIEAGHA